MTDEEIVESIIQIASSFGISCDDASYIVKSFENFGKEYFMSKADKMFEKLGFKILEDTDGIWYQKRNKVKIESVTDVILDYRVKAISVTTDSYKERKIIKKRWTN